jgi:hypothetical protein
VESGGRLARKHAVYQVSHPLQPDFLRLNNRPGGAPNRRTAQRPRIVDLVTPIQD